MRLFKTWVYGVAWGLWLGGCLAAPILASFRFNLALLIIFLVVEGAALLDRDEGDTFSEHVGRFYGERPARFRLVAGLVVYLTCLFLALVFGMWLNQVGFLALGLGLGSWLWIHFREMGRDG